MDDEALARELLDRYGELVTGQVLMSLLGYPTATALKQSLRRGQTPVAVFAIPGRRGVFALTRDIAAWLARCRAQAHGARRNPR